MSTHVSIAHTSDVQCRSATWRAGVDSKIGIHLTQLYKHVCTAVTDDLHPTAQKNAYVCLGTGLQRDNRFACGIIAHGMFVLGL